MIYIEQPKAPLIILAVLKDIRKAKIEFTPDIMLTLLSTNHPISIRDLLKEISEGKEADFKEAILETADRCMHKEANLDRMSEIAKIGWFV